jgi:biopolymer transport protein TolR
VKLEFRKEIEPLIASGNIKEVYIQGDNAVPYGIVVRVMGELKNLGIEDVGLVAEPEAPGTERKKRK